jgi:hypothetical protein
MRYGGRRRQVDRGHGRPRFRLSYANVVATLALVLVVGGGAAYAGSKLAKNSVGTKQLKNAAVTEEKIAGSAQEALKGNVGPQGPAGPQGIQGVQGPPGLSGLTLLSDGSHVTAGGTTINSPNCPTGKEAIGGGFSGDTNIIVLSSNPAPDFTHWIVTAKYTGSSAFENGVSSVICATVG